MKKILIALVCVLIGPYFAWRGLSDVIIGMQAKSWPTVQGTIKSTNLTTSRGRKGRMMYTPVIKYDYQVAGTTYTGDQVNNGDRGTSSQGDAMTTVERYREGQPATVHYNPKIPQAAFLEAGATGDNWLAFGFGLLMTGIGLASAHAAWQGLKSNNVSPSSGF